MPDVKRRREVLTPSVRRRSGAVASHVHTSSVASVVERRRARWVFQRGEVVKYPSERTRVAERTRSGMERDERKRREMVRSRTTASASGYGLDSDSGRRETNGEVGGCIGVRDVLFVSTWDIIHILHLHLHPPAHFVHLLYMQCIQ